MSYEKPHQKQFHQLLIINYIRLGGEGVSWSGRFLCVVVTAAAAFVDGGGGSEMLNFDSVMKRNKMSEAFNQSVCIFRSTQLLINCKTMKCERMSMAIKKGLP